MQLLLALTLLLAVSGTDKFLYDKRDSTVKEIKSKRGASKPQQNEIRIYYASWCYHCVNFAPTYKKIANSVIADGYDVTFTALSCVEYGDICRSMKIPGYPAIKAYNFASDGASIDAFGVTIGKSTDGILKYVKSYALKRFSSSGKFDRDAYQSELQSLINETSQLRNSEVKDWIMHTTRSQATDAIATKRLSDALKAFDFLLSTEGVNNISEDKKAALARVLQLMIALMPSMGSSGDNRNRYQNLLNIVNTESMDYLNVHWTQLKPMDETKEILWSSCGENGYTCGLWQLFHFLTIAGEELSLHREEFPMSPVRVYTAANVKDHIRDIVKYFFSCDECREHFLKSFNECEFHHCKNGDNDFKSLQLWLWKLHNSVTARILQEKLRNSNPSSDVTTKASEKILWPLVVDCGKCRENGKTIRDEELKTGEFSFFDEQHIVSYLRETYWDSSWLLEGQTAQDVGSFGSYLTSPETNASVDSSTLFISFLIALCVIGMFFSRQFLLSRNRTPTKNTKTPLLLRASENMMGGMGSSLNYHRVWSDDERGSNDDSGFMNNYSNGSHSLNNSSSNRLSDARQRSTGSNSLSGTGGGGSMNNTHQNNMSSSSISHIGRFGSYDEGTPRPSIRI